MTWWCFCTRTNERTGWEACVLFHLIHWPDHLNVLASPNAFNCPAGVRTSTDTNVGFSFRLGLKQGTSRPVHVDIYSHTSSIFRYGFRSCTRRTLQNTIFSRHVTAEGTGWYMICTHIMFILQISVSYWGPGCFILEQPATSTTSPGL